MMLQEIAAYLQASSVATRGTDLFLGALPDEPSECWVLYEYPGESGIRTHEQPGIAYEKPRIQVAARAGSYVTGHAMIYSAHDALMLVKNMELDSVWYLSIEPLQPPYHLRVDENDRDIFQFNAQVVKRPS